MAVLVRLKDIASINAPEARMLVITPFDAKNSAAIGKGDRKSKHRNLTNR